MGNNIIKDICCLRDRKYEEDDDFVFLSGKSDTYLTKKEKDTSSSKNINALLSTVYTSTSVVSIIIIATSALPATVVISSITGLGLSFYYIYITRQDLKKLDTIQNVFQNRHTQNIKIYDNIIVDKKF